MLSPELETRAFLGRQVVDIYGRSLGRVIGIERNAFGELEGVQVEAAGGYIVTAKARQLGLTPKLITLTPDWKLEAVDIISELSLLRKRIGALESLKDSKEIGGEIYTELLDSQKGGYYEKVKTAEALSASMKHRLSEVGSQISSLTRYLVNAKLDHKSGELDEESLKLAQGSIEPTLHPLIAERNDLAVSLKTLEEVLPSRVTVSQTRLGGIVEDPRRSSAFKGDGQSDATVARLRRSDPQGLHSTVIYPPGQLAGAADSHLDCRH